MPAELISCTQLVCCFASCYGVPLYRITHGRNDPRMEEKEARRKQARKRRKATKSQEELIHHEWYNERSHGEAYWHSCEHSYHAQNYTQMYLQSHCTFTGGDAQHLVGMFSPRSHTTSSQTVSRISVQFLTSKGQDGTKEKRIIRDKGVKDRRVKSGVLGYL